MTSLAAMECEGCADPRDYDNVNWISMPQEEFNTILRQLGTCAACRVELESARQPLKRPGSKNIEELDDDFMADFENYCLSLWDSSKRPHPRGPNRHEDVDWAAHIRRYVYPHHSDVDWYEYTIFVESGGGDDFFLEN